MEKISTELTGFEYNYRFGKQYHFFLDGGCVLVVRVQFCDLRKGISDLTAILGFREGYVSVFIQDYGWLFGGQAYDWVW